MPFPIGLRCRDRAQVDSSSCGTAAPQAVVPVETEFESETSTKLSDAAAGVASANYSLILPARKRNSDRTSTYGGNTPQPTANLILRLAAIRLESCQKV